MLYVFEDILETYIIKQTSFFTTSISLLLKFVLFDIFYVKTDFSWFVICFLLLYFEIFCNFLIKEKSHRTYLMVFKSNLSGIHFDIPAFY
jgi:hypothetical protein